jgi:hypothetical protein
MVFGSDVISFGPSGLRMLWSEIVVQFCFRSPWGGNSSFKTCYGRTKTALVGLLMLVLKRFAGSKTHLIGKNMSWLSV